MRMPNAVAGDARLRHFEHRAPDTVAITDAHLTVGEALDRKVLPELPKGELAATQPLLPILIRGDLIYEDCPMLAAVAR
jgi:hypothetical protein